MAVSGNMSLSAPLERAILVTNIPYMTDKVDELRDKLESYFGKKRHGGGEITKVMCPIGGSVANAIIVFESDKVRETVISYGDHTFGDDPITIQPLPPIFSDIKVEVDNYYWDILPRGDATKLIKTLKREKNITVEKNVILRGSLNELEACEEIIPEAAGIGASSSSSITPASTVTSECILRGIDVTNIPYVTDDVDKLKIYLQRSVGDAVLDDVITPIVGSLQRAILIFKSVEEKDEYCQQASHPFYDREEDEKNEDEEGDEEEELSILELPKVFRKTTAKLDTLYSKLVPRSKQSLINAKLHEMCRPDGSINGNEMTATLEQIGDAVDLWTDSVGLPTNIPTDIEYDIPVAGSNHPYEETKMVQSNPPSSAAVEKEEHEPNGLSSLVDIKGAEVNAPVINDDGLRDSASSIEDMTFGAPPIEHVEDEELTEGPDVHAHQTDDRDRTYEDRKNPKGKSNIASTTDDEELRGSTEDVDDISLNHIQSITPAVIHEKAEDPSHGSYEPAFQARNRHGIKRYSEDNSNTASTIDDKYLDDSVENIGETSLNQSHTDTQATEDVKIEEQSEEPDVFVDETGDRHGSEDVSKTASDIGNDGLGGITEMINEMSLNPIQSCTPTTPQERMKIPPQEANTTTAIGNKGLKDSTGNIKLSLNHSQACSQTKALGKDGGPSQVAGVPKSQADDTHGFNQGEMYPEGKSNTPSAMDDDDLKGCTENKEVMSFKQSISSTSAMAQRKGEYPSNADDVPALQADDRRGSKEGEYSEDKTNTAPTIDDSERGSTENKEDISLKHSGTPPIADRDDEKRDKPDDKHGSNEEKIYSEDKSNTAPLINDECVRDSNENIGNMSLNQSHLNTQATDHVEDEEQSQKTNVPALQTEDTSSDVGQRCPEDLSNTASAKPPTPQGKDEDPSQGGDVFELQADDRHRSNEGKRYPKNKSNTASTIDDKDLKGSAKDADDMCLIRGQSSTPVIVRGKDKEGTGQRDEFTLLADDRHGNKEAREHLEDGSNPVGEIDDGLTGSAENIKNTSPSRTPAITHVTVAEPSQEPDVPAPYDRHGLHEIRRHPCDISNNASATDAGGLRGSVDNEMNMSCTRVVEHGKEEEDVPALQPDVRYRSNEASGYAQNISNTDVSVPSRQSSALVDNQAYDLHSVPVPKTLSCKSVVKKALDQYIEGDTDDFSLLSYPPDKNDDWAEFSKSEIEASVRKMPDNPVGNTSVNSGNGSDKEPLQSFGKIVGESMTIDEDNAMTSKDDGEELEPPIQDHVTASIPGSHSPLLGTSLKNEQNEDVELERKLSDEQDYSDIKEKIIRSEDGVLEKENKENDAENVDEMGEMFSSDRSPDHAGMSQKELLKPVKMNGSQAHATQIRQTSLNEVTTGKTKSAFTKPVTTNEIASSGSTCHNNKPNISNPKKKASANEIEDDDGMSPKTERKLSETNEVTDALKTSSTPQVSPEPQTTDLDDGTGVMPMETPNSAGTLSQDKQEEMYRNEPVLKHGVASPGSTYHNNKPKISNPQEEVSANEIEDGDGKSPQMEIQLSGTNKFNDALKTSSTPQMSPEPQATDSDGAGVMPMETPNSAGPLSQDKREEMYRNESEDLQEPLTKVVENTHGLMYPPNDSNSDVAEATTGLADNPAIDKRSTSENKSGHLHSLVHPPNDDSDDTRTTTGISDDHDGNSFENEESLNEKTKDTLTAFMDISNRNSHNDKERSIDKDGPSLSARSSEQPKNRKPKMAANLQGRQINAKDEEAHNSMTLSKPHGIKSNGKDNRTSTPTSINQSEVDRQSNNSEEFARRPGSGTTLTGGTNNASDNRLRDDVVDSKREPEIMSSKVKDEGPSVDVSDKRPKPHTDSQNNTFRGTDVPVAVTAPTAEQPNDNMRKNMPIKTSNVMGKAKDKLLGNDHKSQTKQNIPRGPMVEHNSKSPTLVLSLSVKDKQKQVFDSAVCNVQSPTNMARLHDSTSTKSTHSGGQTKALETSKQDRFKGTSSDTNTIDITKVDSSETDKLDEDKDEDPISVDALICEYIKKMCSDELKEIRKTCMLQLKTPDPDKPNEQVMTFKPREDALASLADDVCNAKSKFIELYQRIFYKIKRSPVKCDGVHVNKAEHAVKETEKKIPTVVISKDNFGYIFCGEEAVVTDAIKCFREKADILPKPRRLRQSAESTGVSTDTTPKGFKSSDQTPKNIMPSVFYPNQRTEVVVLKDDITKQRVDAIVNAANGRLDHSSDGVAGAISRAAGKQLQSECNRIMCRQPSIPVGNCVETKAYGLPCQYVIHAVGPTYSKGGSPNFFTDLYRTFNNVLTFAEGKHSRSVAIPLISSGNFGGPKDICTNALATAIKDFFSSNERKHLQQIYLVNIDKEATSALQETFSNLFPAYMESHESEMKLPQRTETSDGILMKFKTDEGIEVVVAKGDITKGNAEAIVNAANGRLMHGGGVAGAILRAAGKGIQHESNRIISQRRKPLQVGECVSTDGYNLKCKVIHAVGPIYSDYKSDARFEELLKKTFLEAIRCANLPIEAKRVDVPLISSGIYGGPKHLCAKALVEAVKEFSKSERSLVIKQIFLVNIDEESTDAVRNAFMTQLSADISVSGTSEATVRAGEDSNTEKRDKDANGFLVNIDEESTDAVRNAFMTQLSPDIPVSGTSEAAVGTDEASNTQKRDKDFNGFQARSSRGIVLTVFNGDISKQRVDVIVNPTSPTLRNNGGVAGAIADAAGYKLQQRCNYIYKQERQTRVLNVSETIITDAYDLPCNNVIHTLGPYFDQPSPNSFGTQLQRTFLSCMNLANSNEMDVKTIAFPLIGSSRGPKETCAKAFTEAISEFDKSVTSLKLKEIHLVTKEEDSYLAVQKTLAAYFTVPSTPPIANQQDRRDMDKSNVTKTPETGLEYVYKTANKIRLVIRTDDISQQSADVIVNSTDSTLTNVGDISQQLCKAAGPRFQKECTQLMTRRKWSALKPGELLSTQGYALPCKRVLHLSRPTKTDATQSDQVFSGFLKSTYLASLLFAKQTLQAKSIAIPLIAVKDSSIHVSALAVAEAVKQFSQPQSPIKTEYTIHFINNDHEYTAAIAKAFDGQFNLVSSTKGVRQNWPSSTEPSRKDSNSPNEGINHPLMVPDESERGMKATPKKLFQKPFQPKVTSSSTGSNPTGAMSKDGPQGASSGSTPSVNKPASRPTVEKDKCQICKYRKKKLHPLEGCQHLYCLDCIRDKVTPESACQVCGSLYGQVTEPHLFGKMTYFLKKDVSLKGSQTPGVIKMIYSIPTGIQQHGHPRPKVQYTGMFTVAYLPPTAEGYDVFWLLKSAFLSGHIFRIGSTYNTKKRRYDERVEMADIPLKTNSGGGVQKDGYPDPNYLHDVREMLVQKGAALDAETSSDGT